MALLVQLAMLGAAALPLGLTLFNLLTWRRPKEGPVPGRVSVCVPARNEAETIEACIQSIPMDDVDEVWVLDDGSTDGTGDLVRALHLPKVHVLTGTGLPDGWVGKPHACHVLGGHATGDILLFVDADVTLRPDAIRRLGALMSDDTAVVTAVPHQQMHTWAEQLLMPMLMLTYTAWLPLWLIANTHDPRFLAANGQFLAFRREAYDAIGGFEAVRHEVVDDMAICRLAKKAALKVRFVDGQDLASCRMYGSWADIWSGFSKNLYEGVGAHPIGLAVVIGLYSACFLAPYAALLGGLFSLTWLTAGVAGIAMGFLTRALLALRFGHPIWSVLAHPFAVISFLGIAVNSARWHHLGRIEWAGRVYAPRAQRGGQHG